MLAWLVPHETAAILAQVLGTPYNHAPCHFMQRCVFSHLHFWQNDRDLLCTTAVPWGWNGYWNKSQHRKLTLEKKICPLFLQGFEPATFQSWVQRSNHWAILLPGEGRCWGRQVDTGLQWWALRRMWCPLDWLCSQSVASVADRWTHILCFWGEDREKRPSRVSVVTDGGTRPFCSPVPSSF